MYTSGKIADVESVIIDVGTGYYVERVSRDGADYNMTIMITMQLLYNFYQGLRFLLLIKIFIPLRLQLLVVDFDY